ncbi:hypothetical protein [Rubellimicrobium roseum]|nr:hypothetical protein [Rubellimicrobium roseum]
MMARTYRLTAARHGCGLFCRVHDWLVADADRQGKRLMAVMPP